MSYTQTNTKSKSRTMIARALQLHRNILEVTLHKIDLENRQSSLELPTFSLGCEGSDPNVVSNALGIYYRGEELLLHREKSSVMKTRHLVISSFVCPKDLSPIDTHVERIRIGSAWYPPPLSGIRNHLNALPSICSNC